MLCSPVARPRAYLPLPTAHSYPPQVATVAINNSTNGALLAVRLLGAFVPSLGDAMEAYQRRIEAEVLVKAENLERGGWKAYAVGATH